VSAAVNGDSGHDADVFRLDLKSGRFQQVTLGLQGERADHKSLAPTLS
jgi:hypothetical protein